MSKNYNAFETFRDVCFNHESAMPFRTNNKGSGLRLLSVFFLFCCMLFTGFTANAQNVTVAGANTGNGSYATLGAAFTAIGTSQAGAAITITITGDTNEGTAVALLGAGTWTSVTINPSGARTVTGNTTAGSPMIDFSGADNVTINGLNSGGNSLTISNTTASATSGTSTIRFVGGATNNTITNCTVLGSFSAAVGTNGGTIFFSTDGNTANGNDNNTISNCNLGPAGANLPTKAIYGNGSTTTTAIGNSGINITNNNIYDYFGAAVTSSGIYINGGCNTWSITNNRLYQTATRTWTTGALHNAINIQNTTATSGAQGFTITGNIIGYASNTQTGTYTLTGSTGSFRGIQFNGITGGTVSNINSNTIASVNLSGVTSSGTSTSSPFMAIYVNSGLANTNNNSIGSQTSTGSLVFSTTSTTATDVIGIYNFSSDVWTSNGNVIGGISVTNAAASGTYVLYGIRANTGTGVAWTATSNIIGGSVSNSIQLNATGAASQVIGMFSSNAPMVLSTNTIRNLTSNIGTGTTTGASVIGICHTSTTPVNSVGQNTIFNLSNTSSSTATTVCGIQMTGGSGNVVSKNFIHSLSVASATGVMNGINVGGGTTTYSNNMIRLGVSTTVGAAINGINEASATGTDNFYFNSVYIGGSSVASSQNTFAFNSLVTTSTRSFRNNIFVNARSNASGTASNYAVQVGGTAANPSGLTINYNIYLANGTGGVFGRFNSANVTSLGAWKTAVGQDANSWESDPQFLTPNGSSSTVDLHINPSVATAVEGKGVNIAAITDDFDGQTRSGLSPEDIGADAGNFTALPLCTGTPSSATVNAVASAVCSGTGTTLSLSTNYTDIGITYAWFSGTTSGGPYATALGTNATQATGNLTATTYYVCTITCTNSGLSFTTAEKAIVVNPLPTVTISPTSGTFCSPGGTPITLTASGANTYVWSGTGTPGLSSTTGTSITASPSTATNITAVGTDGNGCVSPVSNTAALTVAGNPTGVTASASPATICSGNTSTLSANASVPTLASAYAFTGSTGTYTTVTGTTLSTSTTDDNGVGNLPIGFTFYYNGNSHTVFGMRTNGLIELSQTSATLSGFSSNVLATNANCIAPLWDDNNMASGTMIYTTTGSPGSRVLTAQWTGMHVGNAGGTTQPTINVQVKLYEGSNKIEFIYGSTSGALTSTTASIGISGASGNFLSVTPTSTTSPYATTSSSTENTSVSSATNFPSGTIYTFTPTQPTYSWSAATNLVSPTSQTTATTALTSTETFTVTATNAGCSATANTTVTVDVLTGQAATVSATRCSGSNFTVTANTTGGGAPFTYSWSDGVGGTYPNAASITANLPAGTYTFTCTITDACGGNAQSVISGVVVNSLPNVVIASTPSNATICGTGSVSMTATGATSYVWTPTTSLTPSNGLSATEVSATTSTRIYTIVGTDSTTGCSASTTQTVTVSPTVSLATVTATPATVCTGSNSQLATLGFVNTSTASSLVFNATSGQALETLTSTTTVTSATSGNDDGYVNVSPSSFTFNYLGTNYTTFSVNTNGYLVLGSSTSTTIPSSLTSVSGNVIYAFGRDGNLNSTNGGSITHGPATGGKYVFQLNKYSGGSGGGESATIYATYQIVLWGSTSTSPGRIDIIYGDNAGTPATGGVIGIKDSSSNYINAVNGSTTVTSTASAWPTTGQMYSFTKIAASSYSWSPTTFLSDPNIANPMATGVTTTTSYTVTASAGGCSATGNVTVTTSNGAAITTQPVASAKCAGENVSFTVVANGPDLTYQWRKNGIAISAGSNASAITATLNLTAVTASDIANYDVVVSASCGSPVTSDAVALSVTTPLATLNVSPSASICTGDSVTLTENGGNAASWSWTPGGATSQAISVTPSSSTTYTVTTTLNGCTATASQLITVNPIPSAVTITPSSSTTICSGSSVDLVATGGDVNLTSAATASSGTINLAIPDNSSTGNSNTLAISGVPVGATINSVVVTFNATQTYSGDFELNLQAPNGQIINLVADKGSSSGLGYVNTSVTSDTGATSFGSGSTPFTGTFRADATTQASLIGSPVVTTTTFSDLFSTPNGNWIIRAYDDASGDTGSLVNWSISVNYTLANPASYSWSPGTGLSATTGATVTASPTTNTTYTATSTVNGCASHSTIDITVNPSVTPTLSFTTTHPGEFCEGTNVTFTATTNNLGGGTASYDFKVNGSSVQNGASNTYATTTLADGDSVSVDVTITGGTCLSTSTLNSSIGVTVNPNPTITATAGANGSISPAGVTTLPCDGSGDRTYTITPNSGYLISDVTVDGNAATALTTGSYATGGTYVFTDADLFSDVFVNHTISVTFALACTNSTAPTGVSGITSICNGGSTTLTVQGGSMGSNAVVQWFTGSCGGASAGTGNSITVSPTSNTTYYVRYSGDCNTTSCASVTVNVGTNVTWYRDFDNDGYGDFNVTTTNCTQPNGYVANSLDCNDANAAVHPGALEICFDGVDNDCDNLKSEGCQAIASSLTAAYPNNFVLGSISTTVLATIPVIPGGYPITGYVFEITNQTTNQTVELPRSNNKFNLTMTNIYAYDTPYAVRVKVIVNGEEQPYLGDTRIIRTPALASPSLVTTQCSQSLPIGTTIVSASVTGATDYEFTITSATFNNPSYPNQVIVRQVNNFRLSMMPNYSPAYNTVYTISVRAKVAGAWSSTASSCNITTLGLPTTSLVASQCNTELAAMSTAITATNVAYATAYTFKVSKVSEGVEEEVTVPTPMFRLDMLTSVAVDYETDYNVWVKAGSTVNGITSWGDYAATPCVITTPITPTVHIVGLAGDCENGYSPATLSTVITSETYPNARYRFFLRGYDSQANLIYNDYVDRNTNDVTLAMFSTITSGLDYYISVGVRLSGVVVVPKEECLIFIPSTSTRVAALPFKATAYPNPFANNFNLDVTTSSHDNIDIQVYDMVGRLVEQREVKASDVETTTIGERYPSGVYNVVVTQGEEVQTVRVVKR